MKLILSKREKFSRLWDEINEFFVINRFNGVSNKEKERMIFLRNNETYNELKKVFDENKEDIYDKHKANNIIYDETIKKCLSLIKQILKEYIGEPIVFGNGFQYDTIEDYIRKFDNFLNAQETDGFEEGSNQPIELDNYKIIKHSDLEVKHIYGSIIEFDESFGFSFESLEHLKVGMYSIDGYRFDLRGREEEPKNITIYSKDKDNHPIIKYIKKDMNFKNNIYKIKCDICGDGGCFNCEPFRFI